MGLASLQKLTRPLCSLLGVLSPFPELTFAFGAGEEGLKICENATFDVIIVDQYMEEAGGVLVGTEVVLKSCQTDCCFVERQFLELAGITAERRALPQHVSAGEYDDLGAAC